MKILVTGAAGFIGYHLAQRLLERGDSVVGLDNLNAYYEVTLKEARLAKLRESKAFAFVRTDIADRNAMARVFERDRFDAIAHMAAQPGVRYSIENPHTFVESNITGFVNVLEGARHHGTGHLVFASTSSVYGLNTRMPATKKANEAMAHAYAHLFGVRSTGLRFFTVYGPWGRPDMALFKFARGILAGEPIPVYNEGKMVRDFTYIDDIVEGVVRTIDRPAQADPAWDSDNPDPAASSAPWRLYNIGNHQRVELMTYIRALESALGKKAKIELLPMQAGDMKATEADTRELERVTGFKPTTPVEEGVRKFVSWYREYYKA